MIEIISHTNNEIMLQVKVKLNGSLMEMEESIQDAVNDMGTKATESALQIFDTNGAPIQVGNIKMTSKGKVEKCYETPYGATKISRHVYQTSAGGKTYCPLDEKARIVTSSTPKFAKMITYKYTDGSAKHVAEDLKMNHGRSVARSFLQNVVDVVGSIAEATEEEWMYAIPKQDDVVSAVAISLDGTCVLMRQDGYREAMTGNISLYNPEGERLHSIYLGAAPEHGKQNFLARFEKEIYQLRLQYPDAQYIGIADGAKMNWKFLERHTTIQILDFYHVSEYLTEVAKAVHPHFTATDKRKTWLSDACHILKHNKDAANDLLDTMENLPRDNLSCEVEEKLDKAITYFKNQKHRMEYDRYRKESLPIGSGVTEAACKTLVKQRLCQSGMKWGKRGTKIILCLRALVRTQGRFDQFWERMNAAEISGLAAVH